MPPVPTYDQVYGSLGGVYDPQTQVVQSEIDQLAPQQQVQQSALDQAKVNAFKDITDQSNARGVLFSGVPINDQAQYVGTKYLPAVANLQSTFQNNKNTLLDKINQINSQRSQQAQGIVSDAQSSAEKTAYDNAKLQISAAKAGNSNAASLAAKYKVTGKKSGGYNFSGPNGTPISLGEYIAGSGGDANTLLDLLQNGSSYDKNIYNQVKGTTDPNQLLSKVSKLDKANYYGLQ